MQNSTASIKRAQKESLFFRHISTLFHELQQEDTQLSGLFINRVKLSTDKSICFIYFYTPEGIDHFEQALEVLKLYKPALRKALAAKIHSRYIPELLFKFDESYAKQERLEQLLTNITQEDQQKPDSSEE